MITIKVYNNNLQLPTVVDIILEWVYRTDPCIACYECILSPAAWLTISLVQAGKFHFQEKDTKEREEERYIKRGKGGDGGGREEEEEKWGVAERESKGREMEQQIEIGRDGGRESLYNQRRKQYIQKMEKGNIYLNSRWSRERR